MKRILLALLLSLVASTASARNFYIPVAGVAPGAHGTLFRTDVRIFNPTDQTYGVSLHFLPQRQDNANVPGIVQMLAPRQQVTLENIVGNLFGYTHPVIGAIRIDSDTFADYPVIVSSRTYTDVPDGFGTYGQFVPALEITSARRNTVVMNVVDDIAYRTNVGVMNPNRETVTVTPSLYDASGRLVMRRAAVRLEAMSMFQLSVRQFFGDPSAVLTDGYVVFESTEPVFTYASIIDNRSNDQIFVPGVEDDRVIRPLP
jgi:hypothetical protein